MLYDNGGSAGRTDRREDRTALTGKTVFRSRFDRSAFSSGLAMPISSAGTLRGAVYLREYDTERAEIILGVQSRPALAVADHRRGGPLLVAGVFVLLMRRLQALVRSMHVVAEGDYTYRHPVRGRDEISELGEEFNLLTERLETTEQQRRRFVSDASHELKTPLASIRLLSDSIVQNENMDEETVREFVTDIGSEAQRLQRTTEKLLDLSRLDDQVQFVPEPVDLKQTALDAIALLRPLAQEKNVRLTAELAEGCVIMATVDDLFQVIFNLTENAIKYNVPEGSVLLPLHGDGGRVEPHGGGHRHRHPRGGPAQHLRPLLPGGQGPLPGGRRQRSGLKYRTRRGAGPRRQHRGRTEQTAGIEIHRHAPAGIRRGDRYMNNIARIQQQLVERDLDALLITDEKNQRYAAGFPFTDGSVLVSREKAWLITDSRYIEAAEKAAGGCCTVQMFDRQHSR